MCFLLLLQAMGMTEHAHHAQQAMEEFDPESLNDHHMAGFCILAIGILFFLEQARFAQSPKWKWIKFIWPLTLLALATFLLAVRDPVPWQMKWRDLIFVQEFQHKIFETAAILMAMIEILRRVGWLKHRAWALAFNSLILFAGGLLFFHSGGQHAHIIHVQHQWMGAVVLGIGVTKTAADLDQGKPWMARYIVPLLFVVLGVQFARYVE
jgi:hypothetical protein